MDLGFVFDRFQPDKGFSGTDQAASRDGPVQFEKDVEEDPFGLNKFLTEAKKAKRPSEGLGYCHHVDQQCPINRTSSSSVILASRRRPSFDLP